MTNNDILGWIKINVGPIIKQAITETCTTWITEELLGAMAFRECGNVIAKGIQAGESVATIAAKAKGDGGHGHSFWQIDDRSFPAFTKSEDWKDPINACKMAISVLNGKRRFLNIRVPSTILYQACVAAYNTGEGNVVKSVRAGKSVDTTTAHGNYSADVIKLAAEYKAIVPSLQPVPTPKAPTPTKKKTK